MFNIQERLQSSWEYLRTQKVAISFSGGMESTAVLVLALKNVVSLTVLTTSGDPDHRESAQYCADICNRLSVPLIDVKTSDSFKYFVKCINSRNDYLSAFRKSYIRQYNIPIRKLLAEKYFTARLTGYRAKEFQWHMGQRIFALIFDWSKSDIKDFLKRDNIRLHPCYSQSDFLKPLIRESSWIDIQYYGLFHLADKGI